MKTALILAVFCAVAYATPTTTYGGGNMLMKKKVMTDKVLLNRQLLIFRMLKYMNQPTYYDDFVKVIEDFTFDDMKQYWNGHYFVDFKHMWDSGAFLPRGEIFSIFDETHLHQVKVLFDLFYYAKDFDSFMNMAIWCRNYINEGMFLYTFSVAIIHRVDCYGLILPPIYEIYPYYFVNSEIITKAHILKETYGGYFKDGHFVGMVDKDMHVDYHSKYNVDHHHGHLPHVEFINNEFIIYGNFSGWYVKASPEQKLSYFTEDFGMNAFYYYYNLYFPYWMNFKDYNIHFEHRGEYVYYFYQQLLSYYYMHRLANNMGTIDYFDYDKYVKTGYYPTLFYPNGMFFPVREEYSYLYHYSGDYATYSDDVSYFKVMEIKSYETRIKNAIDLGFIYAHDGTKIELYTVKGLNYLGNLLQGNDDSVNKRFYGSLFMFFRTLLGYSYYPIDKNHVVPSVMEHFETCMRDPVFYQFFKRILFYFHKYKYNLPKYTYTELFYEGVKIDGIYFDKLYTYFENFDVDLSHVTYVNKHNHMYDFPVKARYQHFTHKPFTYKVLVNSKLTDKVVVRTFLGPKFDEWGNKISMFHNYYNFVELDQFVYDLKIGKNEIIRDSKDFLLYMSGRTSYKTLYQRVMRAVKEDTEFMYDVSDMFFGRPRNFMLPMGKIGGMEYQVYVYICPFKTGTTTTTTDVKNTGYYSHLYHHMYLSYDHRPLGFPLDRPMSYFYHMIPNSFMSSVFIYFKNFKEDINKVIDY